MSDSIIITEDIDKIKNTSAVEHLRYLYFDESSFIDNKYIHQDGYLAVNVKWRYPMLNKNVYDNEEVYEYLIAIFWEKASEIAKAFGYTNCHSYGRSGGWVIPYIMSDKTKYNYLKATSDENISNVILQERFQSFASYIEKLWTLINSQAKAIETRKQLEKLQERIEAL